MGSRDNHDTAVLVTRPAGAAADTLCASVAAAGFKAYSEPLLELQAVEELSNAQRKMVLDLDLYQHVIFISANAVRFGMEHMEACWPQWPEGLRWYAIGSATAAHLKHFGIDAITPDAAMSSEGLMAVPDLQSVQAQRVLIVKGEGGRDTLVRELKRRGASVDELQCYRRHPVQLPAGKLAEKLLAWQIRVILLSSGEGLANLRVLLRPTETTKLKQWCVVVPSERVARMASDAGFEHIETAENASDAAMIRALEAWNPGSGE